jgi:hypothetical protein
MSTFNPSKARQEWQDFKKKNPSVEKLRNYPKGIGNLLDGNAKIMQLAVAASDDYHQVMDEFVNKKFDLKKREKAHTKYDQALENVLDHFRAIGGKFKAMEDLIKSSAAKDPTVKPALTDWSLFASKTWTPLQKHFEYVSALQGRVMRHSSYWNTASTVKPPEKPKTSKLLYLKEWLGRPYRRYVDDAWFAGLEKSWAEAAQKQREEMYKF